ncbi:hypothetical protein BHM03_00050194 [Ensete ventricosum]|nr:hypothetical protein BHM03_00050194 [Ensete ventricosum]
MTPQTRTGQQIKLASFRTIQDSAQSLKNTWSDVTRYETMLVGPHCAVRRIIDQQHCHHGVAKTTSLLGREEIDHSSQLGPSLVALGVMEMEYMLLPLRLQQQRLPLPPAPPQRLVVRPAPFPQPVLLRHRHQHPPAGQRPQARRQLRQRVHPRVVQARRPRTQQPPQAIDTLAEHGIFRTQQLRPPEERVDQQQPLYHRSAAQNLRPRPQGHLVRYVAARAVPGQEHSPQVPTLRDPRLPCLRHPPNRRQ